MHRCYTESPVLWLVISPQLIVTISFFFYSLYVPFALRQYLSWSGSSAWRNEPHLHYQEICISSGPTFFWLLSFFTNFYYLPGSTKRNPRVADTLLLSPLCGSNPWFPLVQRHEEKPSAAQGLFCAPDGSIPPSELRPLNQLSSKLPRQEKKILQVS